jgi:hypothetical protein
MALSPRSSWACKPSGKAVAASIKNSVFMRIFTGGFQYANQGFIYSSLMAFPYITKKAPQCIYLLFTQMPAQSLSGI